MSILGWDKCYTKYGFSKDGEILNNVSYLSKEIVLQGNGRYEPIEESIKNHEQALSLIHHTPKDDTFDKNLYHKWVDADFYINHETDTEILLTIAGNISFENRLYNNQHVIPRVGEANYLQIPFKVGEKLALFNNIKKNDLLLVALDKDVDKTHEFTISLEDITTNKLLDTTCNQEFMIDTGGDAHSPENLLLCGRIIYRPSNAKKNHEELLASDGNFKFTTNADMSLEFLKKDANNSDLIMLNGKILLTFDDKNKIEDNMALEDISDITIEGLDTEIRNFDKATKHGGFILNIQHSASIVTPKGSDYDNNGKIEFIISDTNPNTSSDNIPSQFVQKIDSNNDDNHLYKITPQKSGKLWLRVYLDDKYLPQIDQILGHYNITWSNKEYKADFIEQFFLPITTKIFNSIGDGMQYLRNMVCVTEDNNTNLDPSLKCKDLFFIFRMALTMYVIFYGFSFLLGIVTVNQYDLVIRIVKIALVASLINGSIVSFIEKYVLDFVLNFSDIILNKMVDGEDYTVDVSNNASKYFNLSFFKFTSSIFSKFIDPLFWKQLLGLMGAIGNFGLIGGTSVGIILGMVKVFFILISCVILIIALLEIIAIVIAARLFLILLIALTPIFIVSLLFSVTRDLFTNFINWITFFIFLPIFLIGGMVLIVNIFTVFLEDATAFSICSKCAYTISVLDFFSFILTLIPFAIPVALVVNIILLAAEEVSFLHETVFLCFPYFQPWGHHFSFKTSNLDVFSELATGITLFIVSMILREYGNFISSILESLLSVNFSVQDYGKKVFNKVWSGASKTYYTFPKIKRFVQQDIKKDIWEYYKNSNTTNNINKNSTINNTTSPIKTNSDKNPNSVENSTTNNTDNNFIKNNAASPSKSNSDT